jgi:hypothetical protein
MPHKFNEDRRHKIAKQKFQVTNWAKYNESLRQRGDLTVSVSDEALSQWSASRRTSRGGQPKYSDLAITMCLTLRVVYDRSPQSAEDPSIRDRHIAEIETKGRMAWQKSTGYNQRSRVETQIGRWKAVIGPKLKARNFGNQETEAKIGVRVLNRMTELGRPEFKRVA